MPRSDLDTKFKSIHDKITDLFYVGKSLDAAPFQKLHTACWLYHEKGLTDAGYIITPAKRVSEINSLISATNVLLPDLEAYQ